MRVLSDRLKRSIKKHALYSMYRPTTKGIDCYAFRLYIKTDTKVTWDGEYDWSHNLNDKEADYLFMLKDHRFVKNINKPA